MVQLPFLQKLLDLNRVFMLYTSTKNQIVQPQMEVRQVAIGIQHSKNMVNGEKQNVIKAILAILQPMKKEMERLL